MITAFQFNKIDLIFSFITTFFMIKPTSTFTSNIVYGGYYDWRPCCQSPYIGMPMVKAESEQMSKKFYHYTNAVANLNNS